MSNPFLDANQADLDEWYALTQELPTKIEREKQLRQKIFLAAFPNPTLGTSRLELGYGKDLKATYQMSYSVNRQELEKHRGKVEDATFDRVIKFKPEVSVGEWKKSTDAERVSLSLFVTEKPSLPALEIVNLSKTRR